VALTNVVVFALLLKFTTDVETNPDPFTVSVNCAPPTEALVGESVVITGVGFDAGITIVKSLAVLPPLPGAASPGSATTAVMVTFGTAPAATETTSGKTKLFMPGLRIPVEPKPPLLLNVHVAV